MCRHQRKVEDLSRDAVNPRRTVALLVMCGIAVSSCTGSPSDSSERGEPGASSVATYAGLLPNLCDDLLSPVLVADLLSEPQPGQRSYTYQPPDAKSGLLRGMTCEHGINRVGPALTVSAQEYADQAAARSHYGALTAQARDASRQVSVDGRPGRLTDSAQVQRLVVLDGQRTIECTLRAGAVASDRVTPTLQRLAASVIERISSRR